MKYISIVLIVFLFQGCVINGTLQGLTSYYKQTKRDNPNLIQKPLRSVNELYANGKIFIYSINGNQLKEGLSSIDKSIVYLWKPNCTSKNCLPLGIIQNYCTSKNIDLFIVAEYYDSDRMNTHYSINRPIFGIDCDYYGTQFTKIYLRDFFGDLTQRNDIDITQGTFFIFRKDSLIRIEKNLKEIVF